MWWNEDVTNIVDITERFSGLYKEVRGFNSMALALVLQCSIK